MTPSTELKLPIELLPSIFELVLPKVLAALTRCNKRFYELCNPLLYKEVHLHTPTQLVLLSGSQKAVQMLGTTRSLLIDEFALYLEAWDDVDAKHPPNPFHYLVRVLHAATSLRSFKVGRGDVPVSYSKRADWGEESDCSSELLRSAVDPGFLPELVHLSVFNPAHPNKSCFDVLRRDRAVECYSLWNNTDIHVKVSPASESSNATAPDPQSPPSIYSQQRTSGQEVGRLIWKSVDANSRPGLNYFGFLVQFPDVVFDNELPPIHNIFPWLKDVLAAAEFPQLQVLEFHVVRRSQTWDWAIALDAQRSSIEELQAIAPKLESVGISSSRTYWKRWIPAPGETSLCPTIPHWTPCPAMDPQVDMRAILVWWLDALGLDVSGMQDRKAMKDFAKQLSAAMNERWDFMAPSEATLYDRLFSHF
ncbi:unnamed protein product [Rhizoctonia solani]|uniref:F-box domain-containing protein n=1 Tax=Rhizoctonia solani TaxID=456999 RepID=A0A8H3AGY4_9AGAM|nr:unnamed protein product [Rhizoctonia solani]